MRYIIFIFFILCTLSAKSQQDDKFRPKRSRGEFTWYTGEYSPKQGDIIRRYDTTILYQGEDNQCEKHEWVSKINLSERSFPLGEACSVGHGPIGCPDDWLNIYQICSKCLRWEKVKEERVFIEKKDPYNVLLEKVNAKIKEAQKNIFNE